MSNANAIVQLSLSLPDMVDEQLAVIDLQIAALQAERNAVQRSRLITCERCKVQTPIASLTYVQTHRYVSPHGCSGGDYWREGEGLFECPACTAVNRIPTADESNPYTLARSSHVGLAKLKRYFGATVDRRDP